MKIATWNLERPKPKAASANAARLAQMQAIGADVWVLTETSAAVIPEGYFSVASPEQPNYHSPGESYAAIHSRFPILQQLPTWNTHPSVC